MILDGPRYQALSMGKLYLFFTLDQKIKLPTAVERHPWGNPQVALVRHSGVSQGSSEFLTGADHMECKAGQNCVPEAV